MPATTMTLLDSISPGALTAIDKAKIGAAGIYEEADIEEWQYSALYRDACGWPFARALPSGLKRAAHSDISCAAEID
jgi:hypothetical protein